MDKNAVKAMSDIITRIATYLEREDLGVTHSSRVEKHQIERAFRAGFAEGFDTSREGFNGGCRYDHCAPEQYVAANDPLQSAEDQMWAQYAFHNVKAEEHHPLCAEGTQAGDQTMPCDCNRFATPNPNVSAPKGLSFKRGIEGF